MMKNLPEIMIGKVRSSCRGGRDRRPAKGGGEGESEDRGHPQPWGRRCCLGLGLGLGAMIGAVALLGLSVGGGGGGLRAAPASAPVVGPVLDITDKLGDKPFEFRADLPAYTLGAILASVAERMGANYSVTAAAEKLLKKRWKMDLATASELVPNGPTLKIEWTAIKAQLDGLGIDVYLSELGPQRLMKVSAAREHLLLNLPAGVSFDTVKGPITAHTGIPDADMIEFTHAALLMIEGSPEDLRKVEKLARTDGLDKAQILSGDESGQYVLHYRLDHAWAMTNLKVQSLKIGTESQESAANGIASALHELLKDYHAVPEFVQRKKLGGDLGDPDVPPPVTVASESERTTSMKAALTEAGLSGYEPLTASPDPDSGVVPERHTTFKSVPLRTETDRESLAESLAPIGARNSLFLSQGGTILDLPSTTMTGTRAEGVQDAIESRFQAKLIPLEEAPTATPGAATSESAETPEIGAFTVVGDHANNALLVICPPAKRTDRLKHLLTFLEKAIGLLDEPVNMVELSAAIIDIDQSHLMEWGPRFAVASAGKLGGWPTGTRSGFDLPKGNGTTARGLFSGLLDPTTGGAEKITAEAVAGEGLNIGALFVGSSVKLLATLRALEMEGDGHVLARPSVVTLDNTEAWVSESTKFYLSSSGLNSGALTQVEVPLEIKVTPQVIKIGPKKDQTAVSMRIRISDGAAQSVTVVDYGTVNTSAIVTQGESVLIAGRLRHEEQDQKRRVPLLGSIPGLGWAFKNSSVREITQQRMIMITPTVVKRAGKKVLSASQTQSPTSGQPGGSTSGSPTSTPSTGGAGEAIILNNPTPTLQPSSLPNLNYVPLLQ